MRGLSLIVPILLFVPISAVAAGQSAAGPETEESHYVVLERRQDGAIAELVRRRVRVSASRLAAPGLASSSARQLGEGEIRVRITDDDRVVNYERIIEAAVILRGEFRKDGTAKIESHIIPLETIHWVIRVPVTAGDRMEVETIHPGERLVIDLSIEPFLAEESRAPDRLFSAETGSPANRLDLLIVGDGYTLAEESTFDSDATTLANEFLEVSPYVEYRSFVNIQKLFVPSPESGADHPPFQAGCSSSACCADNAAAGDPKAGRMVETAFDARYCAFQAHRLLVVDNGKVFSAAASFPDWDQIMVLVNDETYGGSGGAVPVVSTHDLAVEIARHEYGHSFTELADEYSAPYPGYPFCSDRTGPGCEANVTDETAPALIKWSHRIEPSTPIPTPDLAAYDDRTGLFAGARYHSVGFYRSYRDCLMRSLGREFCPVCSQAYIERLYRGGWGAPANGIRLIEPGSAYPWDRSIVVAPETTTSFGASVIRTAKDSVVARWLVDGVEVDTGPELDWIAPEAGWHSITLIVEDSSPMLPEELRSITRMRLDWSVVVRSEEPPPRRRPTPRH